MKIVLTFVSFLEILKLVGEVLQSQQYHTSSIFAISISFLDYISQLDQLCSRMCAVMCNFLEQVL